MSALTARFVPSDLGGRVELRFGEHTADLILTRCPRGEVLSDDQIDEIAAGRMRELFAHLDRDSGADA